MTEEFESNPAARQTQAFVDDLRKRIDSVKESDNAVKDYVKKERKKRTRHVDSDLSEFLVG